MSTKPPSEVLEHISFDPETGSFWRIQSTARVPAGSRADTLAASGYRRVKFKGKYYSAHRLAWFLVTGEWPELLIDHKNMDKGDNRFSNLRLATHSQNTINTVARGVLPRGVTFHKREQKFQAQIKAGGERHYLGLFDTAEQAHNAYLGAALRLHGDFARAT